MLALLRITRRADAFCARLDAGPAAFAIVLALMAAGVCAGRHPDMFQLEYDADAAAAGFAEQEGMGARCRGEQPRP
jgi:hypothetical protein